MPAPTPQAALFQDTVKDIRGWEVQETSPGSRKAADVAVSMRGTVKKILEPRRVAASDSHEAFEVFRFTIENQGSITVDWTSKYLELQVGDVVELAELNAKRGRGTVRDSFRAAKRIQLDGKWINDPSGAKEWAHILKCSGRALQLVTSSSQPSQQTGETTPAQRPTQGSQAADTPVPGAMTDWDHARLQQDHLAFHLEFLCRTLTLSLDAPDSWPEGIAAALLDTAQDMATSTLIAVTDGRNDVHRGRRDDR